MKPGGFAWRLQQSWYQSRPWWWLLPLSLLVALVARLRFQWFRWRARQPEIPTLVIGNITVGGTGKTPLVIAIAEHLQQRNLQVAVISRGYGANPPTFPWSVEADQPASVAGDEPLLIRRRLGCPVIIDPNRRRALQQVLRLHSVDVVISDDGLQHFRLPRTAEIVLLDASRGLGNGYCLPAGPLREPASRLQQARWLVLNGAADARWPQAAVMVLEGQVVINAATGERLLIDDFSARYPQVQAVAGIGNPERFFDSLRGHGLMVVPHAFPDHHPYSAKDLAGFAEHTVLMTEKDALKCLSFAQPNHWYLPVDARLSPVFLDEVYRLLQQETTTP